MLDFLVLAQRCAPLVHQDTMRRIVSVESAFNPFAIGVVGGRLERQPRTQSEAVATVRALQAQGYNFSVGLAQVNKQHFERFGLTLESAFEPCANLHAGAQILKECFERAKPQSEQPALRAAFSCYYSGNFLTGFDHGYVKKVVFANGEPLPIAQQVPKLQPIATDQALAVIKNPSTIAPGKQSSKAKPVTNEPSARTAESASNANGLESKHASESRSALIF